MTLHRYIFGQIIWPVLAALVALNGLFLVIQLLKVGEVTFSAGLGWADLLRVSLLFLPGFAVLTVPVAVLTGVLLGFGRMADDGEFVALAAAGVPAHRLAAVPVGLGLAAGLLTCGLAGWVAPASARALHGSFVDLVKRHVVASLQPGRFYEELYRVLLYPHRPGPEPGSFEGFLLYDHRPGRTRHALLARRARLMPVDDGNTLALRLEDGEVHARSGKEKLYSLARFERAAIAIDIDRLVHDRTRFLPSVERLDLEELTGGSAADAGWSELSARDRNRRLSALHRRFAFPAACVVFALLGTALVGSGRLRGKRRTLVAAVVVVAVYYLVMRFSDVMVDQALLDPAWAAWLPDVLLTAMVALWMARRGRMPG